MIDAFITGFFLVFEWPAFGFLILGVLLGIWLGAVPGLGGIIGLVLLLPFVFDMDPVPGVALLLGMFAVTSTSDTVASVMLGIPGTAASQATILDGYPMAQKGQAARAFGAAFTVSAFGGVFGAVILGLSLPIIRPLIMSFNAPELFMLGILGLTMVGTLSGGSLLKGLTVAGFGLLISTVGYAETDSIPRYWFGSVYLLDGVPIIPVVLGLFAIPELLELAVRDTSISRVRADQTGAGGQLEGIKDAFRHWWLALRCAIIGTYVGMLPGLGAAIVDWIAYGHAVQSAKDKSKFGQGDIRGVIAPEAANNATRGGSLIPTLAFAIPGSLGSAILLGALVILGLKPGPEMLTDNLHITYSMVWMIAVANIVASVLLMFLTKQVAKIAFLPGHLIVPGVILLIFMGAWLGGSSMGDWIVCLGMGVIGFVMKRGGWPRPPLILALILGELLENSYQISTMAYDGPGWLGREIVLIIVALIAITLLFAVRGIKRRKQGATDGAAVTGEGTEKNPVISLPLAVALFILFIWAALESLQWPESVMQFPIVIAVPSTAMLAVILFHDTRDFVKIYRDFGNVGDLFRAASEQALLSGATKFFGYLITVLLVSLILGQKIVLPIFIAIYLIRWGKYNARMACAYGFGGWLMLVGFYDQVMHLLWHPSWLSGWLPEMLPAWLPAWLLI